MAISLEKTSNLGRKISVTVPNEQIEQLYQTELSKFIPNAKVEGFRPGKAPKAVIEQRHGGAVRDDVINKLIRESLFESIEKEKCKPAAMPVVEEINAEKGKDLQYVATFEEFPQIELKGLENIKVNKQAVEITDADIDHTIDTIRKQHAKFSEVDRPAQEGDRLLIDFIGYVDDVAFAGGTATDVNLVLGSKSFIPGFEDNLIGAKVNEVKDIFVKFPADYHGKDLAGKDAKFTVTVKKISEPLMPELDADFVKRFGVADGSLDTFKEQIKMHMSRELNHRLRAGIKEQVMKQLLDANQIELPQVLVSREADFLHQQMHRGQNNHDHGHHDHPELETEAKNRVTLSLLIGHIAEKFDVKIDNERVMDLIKESASSYEDMQSVVEYLMNNKDQLRHFQALAQEDAVVDYVLSKAQVNENKQAYQDFMKA